MGIFVPGLPLVHLLDELETASQPPFTFNSNVTLG